jgi:hypothetical protein
MACRTLLLWVSSARRFVFLYSQIALPFGLFCLSIDNVKGIPRACHVPIIWTGIGVFSVDVVQGSAMLKRRHVIADGFLREQCVPRPEIDVHSTE